MNLKKIAAAVSFVAMLPATAFAHGELWYDATSHLPQFKKIVVYPFRGLDGEFKMSTEEKSEYYLANDYFDKRFVRKLKIKTIPLGSSLKENKEIRVDEEKYQSLYQKFPSEKERAESVSKVTGADGYILTDITRAETEHHTSPAKTVTVQMKSWTEEKGGQYGDRILDEKNWTESHTIPEVQLVLYHMNANYNMYNRTGNKIMTYRNFEHTYGESGAVVAVTNLFTGKSKKALKPDRYKVEVFKDIVNEFRKDFEDIQDNFKDNKKKERINKTIGFRNIAMPAAIGGDEYTLKSLYFQMKDSAFKYTNANVDYDGKGGAKYFVEGSISRYDLKRQWIEPYVTTYNQLIKEDKQDWFDGKGIKHTAKIKKYQTAIVDHHGYWQYTGTVTGTFKLLDSNGKVLVTHSATETDDKQADAYLHLLKDFYKKVNEILI